MLVIGTPSIARGTDTPHILDLVIVNNSLSTTNEEKVDILNDYFSSIFINESYEEVEEGAISGISNVDKIVIDEDIILKKLLNLHINKSAGPDQIHPRVLYELRNEIAFPLKLIFDYTNNTIKENNIPTD